MMNDNFVIVAYFTKGTPYETHAQKLIQSLNVFRLPYFVKPIEDQGDWDANTQYKPTFILEMLQKFPNRSIVYVDVDAVFFRYPEYFTYLDSQNKDCSSFDIAVHILDHSNYARKHQEPELLSGTIYFRNTPNTSIIVREWIEECKKDPKLWDQRALATVLKNYSFHILPEEYTVIFDYMSSVPNPVIRHYQASRENRYNKVSLREKLKSKPRTVVQDGVVKISRVMK
jgi:hypothetical protein